MKVVVFGPIDYYDSKVVKQAIEDCGFPIDEIITTEDPGVAASTRAICEGKGIKCRVLAPDWDNLTAEKAEIRVKNGQRYNHRAGFDRNRSLIDIGDAFILFIVGQPSPMIKTIHQWIKNSNKPASVNYIQK